MKINKNETREKMLHTWVQFEGILRMIMNSDELTHQEICVCNLIENASEPLTATDLCEKLFMHKSQMNRTLNRLESKRIIIRERSEIDRRMMYIRLNEEYPGEYTKLHEKALSMIDTIIKELGLERVTETNHALQALIDAFEDVKQELME